MENFRKLHVWEKAHALVLATYHVTKKFPSSEQFGLISQMRRAAVSVVANIAEGSKRGTVKDRLHFHIMAAGSLEELKYYFILGKDLQFIDQSASEDLLMKAQEVGAMLTGLSKSLNS